jgi:hypothetical protein
MFYACDTMYLDSSPQVPAGQRAAGMATCVDPASVPYTKHGQILPPTEQIENLTWKHDPVSGKYFLWCTHIGLNSGTGGEHTHTQHLYWASDPNPPWNPDNQTTILEGDDLAWDNQYIGMPGSPVVKDGMLYNVYDGATPACFNVPYAGATGGGNGGHSIGLSEAPWPFPWANAARLTGINSSWQTAAPVLTGDGTFRVRARFTDATGTARVGLSGGGHDYRVGPNGSGNGYIYAWADGVAPSGPWYDRGIGHTRTLTFKRTGSTLRIICAGVQIYSGPVTTAPLSFLASGNLVIEEARAEFSAVLVGTESPTVTTLPNPVTADPFYVTGSVPSYLQGDLAASLTTAADLIIPILLSGDAYASLTAAADLSTPAKLAADATLALVVTGDLTTLVTIEPTAAPYVNALGTVDIPFNVTGIVPPWAVLAADVAITSDATGDLTTLTLAGDAPITLTVVGELTAQARHALGADVLITLAASLNSSTNTLPALLVLLSPAQRLALIRGARVDALLSAAGRVALLERN